jgi:hydroxypyruvate reductase
LTAPDQAAAAHTPAEARPLAEALYRAALEGAAPREATGRAVAELSLGAAAVHVIAVGKAAGEMAAGAVEALHARGRSPESGVVVAAEEVAPPHPALVVATGDHPVPGERSFAAAERVGEAAARVRPGDAVIVLLSGGATSLIAAPVPGVSQDDLARLFKGLLGAGVDIVAMNSVRKRVLRWGAGRLAAALKGATVTALAVSDVVGDDVAYIASGPCTADTLTAAKVRRIIQRGGFDRVVPLSVREYLTRVHHQAEPETPKPGTSIFGKVSARVLLSNRDAVAAMAKAAEPLGFTLPVRRIDSPVTGDARSVGQELAARLVAWRMTLAAGGGRPACTVAGGETTVNLADGLGGAGGRCQELALAAARELARLRPRSAGITILAAGSDGRDGPTDAAGAVVDAETWDRIAAAGRDPARDLDAHDSHAALGAAGALLPARATGTNVGDVVAAVVFPP